MSDLIKETFAHVIKKEEAYLDLAYAALLIAEYMTHPFEKTLYLDRLDKMAATVKSSIKAAQSEHTVIEILNSYLFDQIRFLGNVEDYYDPSNSFLNRVLDLRRGIPITLSVVYLEVGRRLQLPLWGIGMPGHFIVGYGAESVPVYIDVFNRGRILTEDDCLGICNVSPIHRTTFRKQYLKPVSKRAILIRMLLNLKHIYLDRQDWEAALKTITLMMIIRPDNALEFRDRGLVYYRLKRFQDAIFDLKRFLFLEPDSNDTETIEAHIENIEKELLRLN